MKNDLIKDAVLRIGEVSQIDGRTVTILVDKNKNVSDLLFDGTIIKNTSVGGYIEIRKGFLSIIGKVEGEELTERKEYREIENEYQLRDINKRYLSVKLCGYINSDNRFIGGIKELPLISNEAYLLTDYKVHLIHNLLKSNDPLKITIAKTDIEEIPIDFPVDGLFNSHIAIFGNTGSGKSNTLAALYHSLIDKLSKKNNFKNKCRFFFFDFNGEYIKPNCIETEKQVYNLSTRITGDKIPITFDELISLENMSVLLEATEKTQRPFLNRALRFYKSAKNKEDDYCSYLKNILNKKTVEALLMVNKDMAYRVLDYIEEIISYFFDLSNKSLRQDIEYHGKGNTFFLKSHQPVKYFDTDPDAIYETELYKTINAITMEDLEKISELNQYFIFVLLQLVYDLTSYKIQMDHILPVINRFKSKRNDIEKVFVVENTRSLWQDKNVVVLNLHDVNIDMKKTIPLLLAKHIYNEHKTKENKESLSIIIDEAHNILSKTSFRESEDWKDYRLETFEEIIKEGRKFGVFVTISSQRPNDISETIISQAHNYFIHQLINQRDLQTIGNAVSYIDKVTEESIPTLPVGTCVFSGIATPMPLKIRIDELPDDEKPASKTLKFSDITSEYVESEIDF
jgi:hypothetical protein